MVETDQKVIPFTTILAQAETRWGHARGCDKLIAECKHCQDNVRWFGDLPLPTLARVLEDRPKLHSAQ